MGKFADLHKRWADAKKKLSDADGNKELAKKNKDLIKKNFAKGLGPILDDLEVATKDLLEARKTKFNPEKIVLLSPKVQTLCGEAENVATEYEKSCRKQNWSEAAVVASKIANEAHAHKELEAKEWRPDKEYINLWRYATLEMALSAAGLEDAKTAEDLRKLLEKKNKDINATKKDDKALKENIEKLSTVWLKGAAGEDYLKRMADSLAQGVARALALANPAPDKPQEADAPAKLKKLVPSVQNTFNGLVANKDRIDRDLKALKIYVKKPEVQNSAWKQLGDDNVKTGEDYLKWYTATVNKCTPDIARLPKVT